MRISDPNVPILLAAITIAGIFVLRAVAITLRRIVKALKRAAGE